MEWVTDEWARERHRRRLRLTTLKLLDATQGRDALDPVTLPRDARVAALARAVEYEARAAAHAESRKGKKSSFEDVTAPRGFLRSRPGFPLAGWRVGIPREYFVAELSGETERAWTSIADVCQEMGAAVVPVSLPNTRAALAAYYVIASAEASSNLARYDGVRYGGAAEARRHEEAEDSEASEDCPFREASASFRGAASPNQSGLKTCDCRQFSSL